MAEPWSAREDGRALLSAVTQAIAAERAARRDPSSADLARAVLNSAALQDANRKLLDAMMAEYEPKLTEMVAAKAGPLVNAAVAAERDRIRRMAIRNQAVCTGDEGTSCFFSEMIQGPGPADPETPLSDTLHTLGQVQRLAESMAMSDRADERDCGRRVLAVIGAQGDLEPALPVAAEPDPPERARPWPCDGPEGRGRLTGNVG